MASSVATTASAASVPKTTVRTPSSHLPICQPKVSFRLSSRPKLRLFFKGLQSGWNRSSAVKAQLNEVALDGSANSATTPTKSEGNNSKPSSPSPAPLASEESLSEFISQVANLVKLVDSRDIVELQLKQLDCELLIRKQEAIPQPVSSAPVVMMQQPHPSAAAPPAYQVPAATAPPPSAAAAPPSTAAASPSPPASAPAKSSLPPLKCPMAGTFYRSPGPAEPPFVKVGDKVQKGQVICIIEAMKLMNEIEADQSGTIVEIIAEDGKPVSVDTPLLVIQP